MAKIILDAGHGGADPGAVYNGRLEKDDTLQLTLAVGKLLEKQGVEVFYTRTEDVYDRPFEKAQIANREGGDFFVSIHRNASFEPNQYSGAEMLIYDRSGQKAELAERIGSGLEKVGFRNLGVQERPDLAVLHRTKMPAVLVEVGFIDTDADNARFDTQFDEIAGAIANGILQTLGSEPAEDRTGGFSYESSNGFSGEISGEDTSGAAAEEAPDDRSEDSEKLYHVQVGAFRRLDHAVRMEQELRRQGYSTFITT